MELQDIFIKYEEAYMAKYKPSSDQLKAIYAIKNCRTSIYGANVKACDTCGHIEISYNSCRNRHCPKCQTMAKEKWLLERQDELLPVGYFHVVFTIPSELYKIFYKHKKEMYTALFKAVAETVKELAADKKYLGAQIGSTSILHTWGQNLLFHPHIHMIIPSGGLTSTGKWQSSKKKFFIPVKVLSRKFRGKLLAFIKNNLDASLRDALYNKEWVVYCKPPFKSSKHVLNYLGRYTHRVALSNNRILKVKNDGVTFKWRDYKDNNKEKTLTLSAVEFMRRFLLHILPSGFTKIRHYGFLGNRNKNTKLRLCQKLTHGKVKPLQKQKLTALEIMFKVTGKDFTKCSCCEEGHFKLIVSTHRMGSPPITLVI